MALVRLVVIYPTISSPIWWKHKHLNGRLDAFDMIQFVLVYGAYTTVASLELACSTALWSLCIHIRSSAVWPLFHMDVTVPVVVIPSQWLQIGLQWGVFKPKVEVVHSPQTGSGCLLVAIICWRGIACESSNVLGDSNSAFQHVCAAAINFLIYSVFPSLSTKFSLVVWVLTRSLNHQLVCGVLINILKTTQHRLPNKSAREILFADVTRCVFQVGFWDIFYLLAVSYESLLLDLFELRKSIFTSPLWDHKQILSLPPALQIVPWTFYSATLFHLGFNCVIYKAQFGVLDVLVMWRKDAIFRRGTNVYASSWDGFTIFLTSEGSGKSAHFVP
ncbi:hypothetical protein Bca4012_032305 [Brassica carinata]